MKFNIAFVGICTFLYGLHAAVAWDEVDEIHDSRNLRGGVAKYPPKGFMMDPIFQATYNCSITCAPCPIGCSVIKCTDKPLYIPPKSDMFLPDNLLHRTFPTGTPPPYPIALPRNATGELEWFNKTYLQKFPANIKQSDTKYALTATEKMLLKMSLPEWQEARAAGKYTCMDMATASIKRALYLQEVQKMGMFMYSHTFDWIGLVIKQALKFDRKAKKHGTKKIAPMYCYPIPIKGTVSFQYVYGDIHFKEFSNNRYCVSLYIRSPPSISPRPMDGRHFMHTTQKSMQTL
jgi:hypothetical protein